VAGLQEYVCPATDDAPMPTELPAQMLLSGPAFAAGKGFTLNVLLAVEDPQVLVTVMVTV
jgi:hypothetical protein